MDKVELRSYHPKGKYSTFTINLNLEHMHAVHPPTDSAVAGNDTFFNISSKLKQLGAVQFSNQISASQYFLAYRLLLKYAEASASVLDWGTGEGHFSFFLLEQGFETTGFTVDQHCLLANYLYNRFGERYQLVTEPDAISTLRFSDNQFDVITSIGVLEHVRETGGDELTEILHHSQ